MHHFSSETAFLTILKCVPIKGSDQPAPLRSLIRAFACHRWVAKDPKHLQVDSKYSDKKDCADAQIDPSLIWTHMPYYREC